MSTTMTFTPPALHVQPLASMEPGDTSELGCAPVVGIKVSDFDCCSTEAWVLVGPSLGDEPVLVVECVEATSDYPYTNHVRWTISNDGVASSLDEAVVLAGLLVEDYGYGRRCSCP